MEIIFSNSIKNIRQKWFELVPHIIIAAPLMKNKKIDALLKHPRFDTIKEDFGILITTEKLSAFTQTIVVSLIQILSQERHASCFRYAFLDPIKA